MEPSLPIADGSKRRDARGNHGSWCPPSCECAPPVASLFEMAARRRLLHAKKAAEQTIATSASGMSSISGRDGGDESMLLQVRHDDYGNDDDGATDGDSAKLRGEHINGLDDSQPQRTSTTDGSGDNMSTLEGLLDNASREKQLGNLELLKGKVLAKHTAGTRLLADACQHYITALGFLADAKSHIDADNAMLTAWHDISVSIYLNLSLVGLLMDSFDSALRSADKARELLESGHLDAPKRLAKALFRSARAKIGLGQSEEAEVDLVKSLEISKKNKEARRLLASLRQDLAQARTKDLDSMSFPDLLAHAKMSGMYLKNGGKGPSGNYVFGQTLEVAHLLVRVPMAQRARDVNCDIHRTAATVSVKQAACGNKNGEGEMDGGEREDFTLLVSGDFVCPVSVDDSYWMLETAGILHVELVKETPAWWSSVFVGHPEINTEKCESPPLFIADVPPRQRAEFDRAMHHEMQKTDKEREEDREFERIREERRMNAAITEATTTSNSDKRALYEHLSNLAPGVDIVLK